MQVKAHNTAPKKHSKKTTKKTHHVSTAFRASVPAQNPRRDKLAESVLNIQVPTKPKWQTLSNKPVSTPGTYLLTGADLAPVSVQALPDHAPLDEVDNVLTYLPHTTTKQRQARQLFFNSFPRQTALPAGPILQTAYTNYSIYNQPIDWATRIPGALIRISVKEKPDMTDQLDTRWYKEAMAKPKARVEIYMRSLKFLSKLEQNIMGEILGPRYNWKTGKILVSVGNLRNRHANINRCFQYLHEAAFRAMEIAPHIAEQQDLDHRQLQRDELTIKTKEKKLQAALKPFVAHKARPAVPSAEDMPKFVTLDDLTFVPYDKATSVPDHKNFFENKTGMIQLGRASNTTFDEQIEVQSQQAMKKDVEQLTQQLAAAKVMPVDKVANQSF